MVYDILICFLPVSVTYLPPAAPAQLKGHIVGNGFTCKTLDLNLLTKDILNENEYDEVIEFLNYSDLRNKNPLIEKVVDAWVSEIKKYKFKKLGYSLFSSYSELSYRLLSDKIKPDIIGGNGVSGLSDIDESITVVRGDGEQPIVDFLNNKQISKLEIPLDSIAFADYSDYDLKKYYFYDEPTIQITGSKGCVRDCTFCNVKTIWPQFRFRTGKHIAEEIINNYEKHGIRSFFFTDSLINGSLKQYMQMCEVLAKYNEDNNAGFKWGGQYIVRKRCTDEYYDLTSRSGAYNLVMGIETGSDKVRKHMKKQFTNEDFDATMENFHNYNITCSYLLLIGYPTETYEDFCDTLLLFKRHQKYVASGTILSCTLGITCGIIPDTELMQMENIIHHDRSNFDWTDPDSGSTYESRVKMRIIAQKVAESYGWPLSSADRELKSIRHELTRHTTE